MQKYPSSSSTSGRRSFPSVLDDDRHNAGLIRMGETESIRTGVVREGLLRIDSERTAPAYGAQMAELCPQALGADPRRIAAVIEHLTCGSYWGTARWRQVRPSESSTRASIAATCPAPSIS